MASLENWDGGLTSLLWLANSSKCPQSTNNTKQPQGLQNYPQQPIGLVETYLQMYNIHVKSILQQPHGLEK